MKRKYTLSLALALTIVMLAGCAEDDYIDPFYLPDLPLIYTNRANGSRISPYTEIILNLPPGKIPDVSIKERINGVYKEIPAERRKTFNRRIYVKGPFALGHLTLKVEWYYEVNWWDSGEAIFRFTVVSSEEGKSA